MQIYNLLHWEQKVNVLKELNLKGEIIQQEHNCLFFCWEGCSHVLTTHHPITISVIGNVTKKNWMK